MYSRSRERKQRGQMGNSHPFPNWRICETARAFRKAAGSSLFRMTGRLYRLAQAVKESPRVIAAVDQKQREGKRAAARFSAFQRGVRPVLHKELSRHFCLGQIKTVSVSDEGIAELLFHHSLAALFHGQRSSFARIYRNSIEKLRYTP